MPDARLFGELAKRRVGEQQARVALNDGELRGRAPFDEQGLALGQGRVEPGERDEVLVKELADLHRLAARAGADDSQADNA